MGGRRLAKRRPKKRKRTPRRPPASGVPKGREPSPALRRELLRAERLIDRGESSAAIALLEPLAERHSRVAELQAQLAYAYANSGDLAAAARRYEQALALSGDPSFCLPLAGLYGTLGFPVHALDAIRRLLKEQGDAPTMAEMQLAAAAMEQHVQETADELGLSASRATEGLRELEVGRLALEARKYRVAIAASRRARTILGKWPAPRNNLALALFFAGQPRRALSTAQQVLTEHPENLQALSNAIRFLAWTGRKAEAEGLWARLRDIRPQGDSGRLKKAEAAQIMEDDQAVYGLLRQLEDGESGLSERNQLALATAEANTGQRRAALRRLRTLPSESAGIEDWIAALEDGRPGPGWAERFPYHLPMDYLPASEMDTFVQLLDGGRELPEEEFRRRVQRFAERFPQIVLASETMIWVLAQPEVGARMLADIATPEAYAALRRFGTSQAGDDEVRMRALTYLAEAGEIDPENTVRLWSGGEWRDVLLRRQEITTEPATIYDPEVGRLMDEGNAAFGQGDSEGAEALYRRALALDPQAKEAHNNLGTLYARQGQHEKARQAFQAAVVIDPLYAFPRCNLASYLLDEGEIEEAQQMIEPLVEAQRFTPHEAAYYFFTQARIHLAREEFEHANRALRTSLELNPDYAPAKQLLERVDMLDTWNSSWEARFADMRSRDRAKRARLQAELSTREPTLSKALPLYTVNALTAMAREVMPWGGWSGSRKAELVDRLIRELSNPLNLGRLVNDLAPGERRALRTVLDRSGAVAWQAFDDLYGNDLEESRHWDWRAPETVMGRLRARGLLVEATVEGELIVAVPADLRSPLRQTLRG